MQALPVGLRNAKPHSNAGACAAGSRNGGQSPVTPRSTGTVPRDAHVQAVLVALPAAVPDVRFVTSGGLGWAAPSGAPVARQLANPSVSPCRRIPLARTTFARECYRCEPSGRSCGPGQRPSPPPHR